MNGAAAGRSGIERPSLWQRSDLLPFGEQNGVAAVAGTLQQPANGPDTLPDCDCSRGARKGPEPNVADGSVRQEHGNGRGGDAAASRLCRARHGRASPCSRLRAGRSSSSCLSASRCSCSRASSRPRGSSLSAEPGKRSSGQPVWLAAFLVFWSGLSLLWTPFPNDALERLLNMAGFGFMGLVAVSALPERMRASNLYLLPLGVGLAAILALSLTLRPMLAGVGEAIDRSSLDRALLLLVLMTPAAVTWLLSKDRLVSWFILIAVVTACLMLGDARAALLALILGAAVFAIATISPGTGPAGRNAGHAGRWSSRLPSFPSSCGPAPSSRSGSAIRGWRRSGPGQRSSRTILAGSSPDTVSIPRCARSLPVWFRLRRRAACCSKSGTILAFSVRSRSR